MLAIFSSPTVRAHWSKPAEFSGMSRRRCPTRRERWMVSLLQADADNSSTLRLAPRPPTHPAAAEIGETHPSPSSVSKVFPPYDLRFQPKRCLCRGVAMSVLRGALLVPRRRQAGETSSSLSSAGRAVSGGDHVVQAFMLAQQGAEVEEVLVRPLSLPKPAVAPLADELGGKSSIARAAARAVLASRADDARLRKQR